MKNYLAIYIGTAEATEKADWNRMDPAQRSALEAKGIAAWGKWVGENQSAIVDMGAPLGKTKRIDSTGILDKTNQMTAYVIVQAESHVAAAALFKNHPHFSIFPGDSVEIMECLPMPGPKS